MFFAKILSMFLLFFSTMAHADAGKDKAEKMVKDAIEFTKKNGKDAGIAAVNNKKFLEGEVYVTIYDMNGVCLAHPTKPARVGQNLMGEKDPAGVFFIKDRIEAAKKGSGWQTYKFQNPTTKKMEPKEAYYEASDSLVFSAGKYTPPAK